MRNRGHRKRDVLTDFSTCWCLRDCWWRGRKPHFDVLIRTEYEMQNLAASFFTTYLFIYTFFAVE